MDSKAGLDMDKIQSSYLLSSGLKMIAMALFMAAATVIVGLIASRIGAGIGRDLRSSVYGRVMKFSNAEMDKFSTASLITRTTNDPADTDGYCYDVKNDFICANSWYRWYCKGI